MAIKVHGDVISTAFMRVVACLYEKELDHEFVTVNLRAGEHRKESFLSFNPFAQVPVFEDGDLKLFESRAISQYIAQAYSEKGTPLISEDARKMATIYVWMEVEAQRHDKPASKLTWELGLKPIIGMPIDVNIVKEKETELAKVLDIYEARLSQSKYLGGESFSLADLNHLPTLHYLMGTKVKALYDSRPHVSAWCKDIMARPAWQKVLALKNN